MKHNLKILLVVLVLALALESCLKGHKGVKGPTGNKGPDGPRGNNGTRGAQGDKGPQGPQGANSTTPGAQGPQGATGPTGAAGINLSVRNGSATLNMWTVNSGTTFPVSIRWAKADRGLTLVFGGWSAAKTVGATKIFTSQPLSDLIPNVEPWPTGGVQKNNGDVFPWTHITYGKLNGARVYVMIELTSGANPTLILRRGPSLSGTTSLFNGPDWTAGDSVVVDAFSKVFPLRTDNGSG